MTKTIGTTGRDYTTIALWEADLDNTGIYASGDVAIGEMYDDSDFTAGAIIDGGGTVGLASRKLTVAVGNRHLGVENGGVRILNPSSNITVSINNTTVEYIEINENGTNAGIVFNGGASPYDANVVQYMMIHGVSGAGHPEGIRIRGNQQVHNNWVYDITDTAGASSAIRAWGIFRNTSGLPGVYNNTVHRMRATGTPGNTGGNVFGFLVGGGTIKNNIATDSYAADVDVSYADFSIAGTTENNNAASDTSISGTGDLQSLLSGNQYVSNAAPYDLSVKNVNADIVDAGVDLVVTPTGVNIDIKGYDRDVNNSVWDIGGHEGFEVSAAAVYSGRGISRGISRGIFR